MKWKIAISILALAFATAVNSGFATPIRAEGDAGSSTRLSFAVAVNLDELTRVRGAGLVAAGPGQTGGEQFGVILWDEFKPRPHPGSVKLDGGTSNSVTSSIGGTFK